MWDVIFVSRPFAQAWTIQEGTSLQVLVHESYAEQSQ